MIQATGSATTQLMPKQHAMIGLQEQWRPGSAVTSVPARRRPARATLLQCASSRREWLASSAAAAAAAVLVPALPAAASVTLTLKSKVVAMKHYTLKAGYTVVVPTDWALAYDRSNDSETGTQVFFANLRTFATLSVFKIPAPQGVGLDDPQQLLESALAEQRDNQSTYAFELLSGPAPTARTVTSAAVDGAAAGESGGSSSSGGGSSGSSESRTFFDSEYVLSICRGLIQEGSGGRRRCVGPNDMDLQIVSRHFYQTQTVEDGFIYIVRGSTTADDQWDTIGPAVVEAVQSFRLPRRKL